MKRRRWVILAVGLVLLLGGGAAWWSWLGARARVVAAAVPPRPDLSNLPPELTTRIAAAEQLAASRWAAVHGLAELATLYDANGFIAEADHCYATLLRLQPDNAVVLHRYATLRAGYGDLDSAIPLWKRVHQLAPKYLPPMIRIGDAYLKTNRDADAARAYRRVLAIDPANPYAMVGLARIDLKEGRLTAARDRLEAAARSSKGDIGSDLLVSVYEQLGDRTQARELRGRQKSAGTYYDPPDPWLEELMHDCYDVGRLTLAAGFDEHRGDPAAARRLLDRAALLAPRSGHVLLQLGMLCRELKDVAAARRHLERAAEVDPTLSDVWAQLIQLYLQQGDGRAAARALATGLKYCPNSPGLHLERARRLATLGRTDAAIAEFRETFRLRPDEADPLIEIAEIYLRQNRTPEAMALLKQSLEVEPEQPVALMTLAMYSIAVGNQPAAQSWMERVYLQTRVPPAAYAQLTQQYAQKFGSIFQPRPGPQ